MNRARKNILNNSFIVGISILFGLILLLFLFEKEGKIIPSKYAKPSLVAVSILSAFLYCIKSLRKLNNQNVINGKTSSFIFAITDYSYEYISNTEFMIIACQTTDRKTIIFQTSALDPDTIYDAFNIEFLNGKIISIKNYSTGKTVRQVTLNKKLLENYEDEFYILEKDLHSL